MIIWSGLGFLVPVIAFGCLVATELLVEAAFRDEQYYQEHGWPKLAAFVVSAVLVGAVGRILRRRRGRVLIDPRTGEEVIVGDRSTFFFIPMGFWAPILVVIGVAFLFVTQ